MSIFRKKRNGNDNDAGNGMTDNSNKLTYTLETNGSNYTNDDLSLAVLEDLLNRLSPLKWDFMVLVPSMPIERSTFIQVGAPTMQTGYELTVEIGFLNPDRLEMYRYCTSDKKEVLQMLADYFEQQKIPDYTSWKDISDEMK